MAFEDAGQFSGLLHKVDLLLTISDSKLVLRYSASHTDNSKSRSGSGYVSWKGYITRFSQGAKSSLLFNANADPSIVSTDYGNRPRPLEHLSAFSRTTLSHLPLHTLS